MKKIISVAFVFLIFSSCSLEEDTGSNFNLEIMPITNVVVPEEFIRGNTYEISTSYNRPSDCYQFNEFIFSVDGNERSVAIVNTVYFQSSGCVSEPEEVTVSFNFTVTSLETHIFKFYQGVDESGIDQYQIVEVPVVE